MNEIDLLSRMADILEVEPRVLSDDLGPGDIATWDSLGHIKLVVGIEEYAGVHLSDDDLMSLESVADFKRIFLFNK
jgi:acyl carrier protein